MRLRNASNLYVLGPSDLTASVKHFLAYYLPQHRGASVHTISSYAQALKSFLAFLSDKPRNRGKLTYRDLTVGNVLAFLVKIERERGNSPSTRNARLAAILSFARFAFLMGGLNKDTYDRLRHIAFKRRSLAPAFHLDVPELEAIYRSIDYCTHDGFRDLTLLKLLYNTGARASEIASLKISDIDLSALHVTITGKGCRQRLCSLWKTTGALLRIYLASERRVPQKGFEDHLFINQRRRPLTRFGVREIVRRYARKAALACPGLAKHRVTPHTFRHTTGAHLLEAGVDLNTIREWLGHEHVSSTEVYARANVRLKCRTLAKLQQLDKRLFTELSASRTLPQVGPSIRRWLDSLQD
jgi:site-specific recombinase XerD